MTRKGYISVLVAPISGFDISIDEIKAISPYVGDEPDFYLSTILLNPGNFSEEIGQEFLHTVEPYPVLKAKFDWETAL